jgi:hypothetical protein
MAHCTELAPLPGNQFSPIAKIAAISAIPSLDSAFTEIPLLLYTGFDLGGRSKVPMDIIAKSN